MKTLQFIQKNLIWSIPLFMILGLIFGLYFEASPLKTTILPLTFLMVYPMMVNLNFKQVLSKGDAKLQIVTQLINFLILPFLGLFIGKFFFPDSPFVIMGLLLTSLLPTSGMTISWTGFAKGNMTAAVKMTVIGLILGSVLTPVYLQFLVGSQVEIPLGQVFKEIIIIVFLPMTLGYITQVVLIKQYGNAHYQKDLKPKFPPFSTLGVLGIVFVAIALKSKVIVADPTALLKYILPLVVMYGVNFLLSTLIGKYFFKRGDGIALVYGTVMRNLSIALAIAMAVFKENGSEIALIIALAYIIQVQAGAWYVRFTSKIFGPVPPDVAKDIMHVGVFTIDSSMSINSAIDLLEREHIHSLVVVDKESKLKGILTTRAIFDHVVINNDIHHPIYNIKLEDIITFDELTPIQLVAREMTDHKSYKAIVVDAQKQPLGIITETMYLEKLTKLI